MNSIKAYVAVAALLSTAGCANSPVADEAPPESAVESAADTVPSELLVIDINELAARTPPPPICRDVLRQGSNVLVRQCRTAEQWKRYERQEAREAQELVRMLQGSRYR